MFRGFGNIKPSTFLRGTDVGAGASEGLFGVARMPLRLGLGLGLVGIVRAALEPDPGLSVVIATVGDLVVTLAMILILTLVLVFI